jgi:K+ transporter
MKKLIALLVVLSLTATMVFAEPVAVAYEIAQTTDSIPEAEVNDSLFADIEVPQLVATDAELVEGGSIVIVIATVVLVCYVGNMVMQSMQKR